ncbi:phosphoserine phosphatase SerB [Curvivirga sp.]|uniref:phosphoserine phosphatase SerB n=1 Tax=Curvivirga sp. TaxID=2856848 RepID=UPI003B5B8927
MTSWAVTLVATKENQLANDQVKKAQSLLGLDSQIIWLDEGRACDLIIPCEPVSKDELEEKLLTALANTDIAIQKNENRRKKLLVADMDSTMIQLETLDYLAEILGFGEEVNEITARSMRGELDFADSLRTRVALLKGQSTDAMSKVLEDIPYTDGAEVTVKTMIKHGAYCALVSGGFTFTTDIVGPKLGFNEARANVFEIEDNTLTGNVIDPILARDSKQHTMEELCDKLDITSELACCIGDGANDLDMIQAAGMGVGFHGKPIVQEKAAFNIRFGDMTTLLYFQGYHKNEFVSVV